MKKFETLKNGLKPDYNSLLIVNRPAWGDQELTASSFLAILNNGISEVTPHLFPLSHLNKPIRVEGYNDEEEFVAYNKLFFGTDERVHQQGEWFLEQIREGKGHYAINLLPYWMVIVMRKMKLNTEGLEPSEFIDASKSKVYEPKDTKFHAC